MKDKFGVDYGVGDTVVSISIHGVTKVGKIVKIFEDRYAPHARMEYEYYGNRYAWEDGAPDVPEKKWRQAKNEDGSLAFDEVKYNSWSQAFRYPKYEEYMGTGKDYTVVGKQWNKANEQVATTVIVLRKADGSIPEPIATFVNKGSHF